MYDVCMTYVCIHVFTRFNPEDLHTDTERERETHTHTHTHIHTSYIQYIYIGLLDRGWLLMCC